MRSLHSSANTSLSIVAFLVAIALNLSPYASGTVIEASSTSSSAATIELPPIPEPTVTPSPNRLQRQRLRRRQSSFHLRRRFPIWTDSVSNSPPSRRRQTLFPLPGVRQVSPIATRILVILRTRRGPIDLNDL